MCNRVSLECDDMSSYLVPLQRILQSIVFHCVAMFMYGIPMFIAVRLPEQKAIQRFPCVPMLMYGISMLISVRLP